jgi:ribosome-associated protein
MITIPPNLQLLLSEAKLSYVRSSGPGGQNVNKVNSKAVLRWNLIQSPSLSDPQKSRLLERLRDQLTQDGELVMTSDRFRDQIRNREDCFEKLTKTIQAAWAMPKFRKKMQPSRSSIQRIKTQKSRNSEKKRLRKMFD